MSTFFKGTPSTLILVSARPINVNGKTIQLAYE
jgi:hypothetical protein